MNRRGFLGAIAAGLVIDPERLLWRPGAKLISIPKPPTILLDFGDMFTIAGVYSKNPVTGEIAIYTDPATGQRYRFRQRFVATGVITNYDGDGDWRRKAIPGIDFGIPWNAAEPMSQWNRRLVEPIPRTEDV